MHNMAVCCLVVVFVAATSVLVASQDLGTTTTAYSTIAPASSFNDSIAEKLKNITNALLEYIKHEGNETSSNQLTRSAIKQTRDGGGGGGGGGGNILSLLLQLQGLQALLGLLSPAAAPPASGSGPAPPASPATPSPLALLALLGGLGGGGGGGLGFGGFGGGGSGSDDADERAVHVDNRNCAGICDSNTVIKTLIALPDHVIAIGSEDAYNISLDGTPQKALGQPKFQQFKKLNGTPTATLRINENYYIFYGSEVALLNTTTGETQHQMPVKDLFLGVKQRVRGAFRFNDHTLALFLDRHFIFYQPLANPPVDPRFSPQPFSVIPDGPDQIDGALEINGTNYLYRSGWMYQVAADEMMVVGKQRLRQRRGWIKCDVQTNC